MFNLVSFLPSIDYQRLSPRCQLKGGGERKLVRKVMEALRSKRRELFLSILGCCLYTTFAKLLKYSTTLFLGNMGTYLDMQLLIVSEKIKGWIQSFLWYFMILFYIKCLSPVYTALNTFARHCQIVQPYPIYPCSGYKYKDRAQMKLVRYPL